MAIISSSHVYHHPRQLVQRRGLDVLHREFLQVQGDGEVNPMVDLLIDEHVQVEYDTLEVQDQYVRELGEQLIFSYVYLLIAGLASEVTYCFSLYILLEALIYVLEVLDGNG